MFPIQIMPKTGNSCFVYRLGRVSPVNFTPSEGDTKEHHSDDPNNLIVLGLSTKTTSILV